MQTSLGQVDEAEAALREGYWLATEEGVEDVAARCAAVLVYVEGRFRGDLEAALRWAEHARTALERHGGSSRVELELLGNLGAAFELAGRPAEARARYEQALELLRRQGDEPEARVRTLEASLEANLAVVVAQLGDPQRARELVQRTLATERALLGPRHPETVSTLIMLASFELQLEQAESARLHLEEAASLAHETLPPGHQLVGKIELDLGNVHGVLGDPAAAARHYRAARDVLAEALGEDHPQVGAAEANLGRLALEAGHLDRAHDHLRQALAIARAAFGDVHPDIAEALHDLSLVYQQRGDCRAAREHLGQAAAVMEQSRGSQHPRTQELQRALSELPPCTIPS